MRKILKGALKKRFAEYVFVKGHKLRDDDSPLPIPDESSARTFLRRFLLDVRGMTGLRTFLLREGFVADVSRLNDQGVIREITRHLVSGRIRILRTWRGPPPVGMALPKGAGAQPDETADERAPRRPAVFPESRGPRNWIRLRVVDDETEEPIPGVVMRVRLPSGKVGTPKTDRSGAIYLDDLDPGTLDILEILDEEAFEVVGIE